MKRKARAARRAPPRGAPARSVFQWSDAELLAALESGDNEAGLREMLGSSAYAELRVLAMQARAERQRRMEKRGVRALRVLILPGIMGSRLGVSATGKARERIVWIDPLRIAAGRLTDLGLPRGAALAPLGALLFAYAKMRFLLEIDGFDAQFHPYDWRLGIAQSGRELAARIMREARPVALVGHSMGGLVARASLVHMPHTAVRRVILLGAPNRGTFAPVQALCGTYPTVRKIALLDLRHSAEWLAKHVFATFPGLYELLPTRAPRSLDLFDAAHWPSRHSNVDRRLLAAAADARTGLAAVDSRYRQILGIDQDTIVAVRKSRSGFEYFLERAGDGTVPLASAFLRGVPAYYTQEQHGSLANNTSIIRCVADLIRIGRSQQLPRRWQRGRTAVKTVTDAQLRKQYNRKVDWRRLDGEQRERMMAQLAGNVAEPALGAGFHRSIGAASQPTRRIAVEAVFGDIALAHAESIVLGVFRNVHPEGAAAAVDRRLHGALREFAARRMLPGEAGQLFSVPAARPALAANVLLAGMGDFDRFDGQVLRFVSENVAHFLMRARARSFATVLFGTGSGLDIATALDNQLRGYCNAFASASEPLVLERISIYVKDRKRFASLRSALEDLRTSDAFTPVELRIDTQTRPSRLRRARRDEPAKHSAPPTAIEPRVSYLIVARETTNGARIRMRASLLTSGAKAAIMSEVQEIERSAIDALLDELRGSFSEDSLHRYGQRLAKLVLPGRIGSALHGAAKDHLVVVHDAELSRLPWETLRIGAWAPAAERGLSRLYAAENLSIARWSEARRLGTTLDVLLVANPTEDLPGAQVEARRLIETMAGRHDVRLHVVQGSEASRARLLEFFQSGTFDVLHYAGHAYFDARMPGRSGIVCANREILSGHDLSNLQSLPALVFFNACESARLRGRANDRSPRRALEKADGLAESFLRGGVANYLGTYWPVGDEAALAFSTALYRAIIAGEALGIAVNRARAAVLGMGSNDWADYMHYGSFGFRLKRAGD